MLLIFLSLCCYPFSYNSGFISNNGMLRLWNISMRKIFLLNVIIILLAFFLLNCFAKNNMNQYTALNNQLLKVVLEAKNKYQLTNLSVAILLPGQTQPFFFPEGSSVMGENAPIAKDSLFQVGSVTKTFTATLVAQAIQNQLISLNDPLKKYLSTYPKWNDITVEQLVDQTSGIFDYINSKNWWNRCGAAIRRGETYKPSQLLKIAYQYPDYFQPGTRWSYSNTNYILLGLILEKATHKSMASLMQNLIRSNNLSHTYYLPKAYSQSIMQKMAHGYGYYDQVYDATREHGSWAHTAGAMVSSPEDLVRWMQMLFSENQSGESLPTLRYIHLKSPVDGKSVASYDQTGYSFGLFRMNTPEGLIWFTPGLTPGYVTGMIYAPCQRAYVAYSTGHSMIKGLHGYLITQLLGVISRNKPYQEFLKDNSLQPDYCLKIKPAEKFIFPIS